MTDAYPPPKWLLVEWVGDEPVRQYHLGLGTHRQALALLLNTLSPGRWESTTRGPAGKVPLDKFQRQVLETWYDS